ncbi:dicarboxylate/amino acid:cation symporter [Anaerotignum sp.]
MEKKQDNKLIRQMLFALASSFIIGFALMMLNEKLNAGGQADTWNLIYSLLFADVTKESGLGILFVIQTLFLNGLKLIIVPLVFTSLLLAMDSITDLKKLGRMAYKTVGGFFGVYVLGCILASVTATLCVNTGIFTMSESIVRDTSNLTQVSSPNPMSILVAMVPDNLITTFSNNNAILAVVFIAVVCGLCLNLMGAEGEPFKNVVKSVSKMIQICVDFLINKMGPIAIFAMITRAMALYGLDDVKSVLVYVCVTIVALLIYLTVGYALVVFGTTRLNPFVFLKKIAKVGLFAFSTISSAATLPLNTKTTTKELGIKEDIANFVLPLGMTINMNGTAIMHVIGTTFIATVAGYDVGLTDLMMMSLLAIMASAGTPAIPAAGSVLLLTVVTGMGFTNEVAMMTYALILAINKPVEMVLTSLNVVGDASVALMVANSEGDLDKDVYYDRKKLA